MSILKTLITLNEAKKPAKKPAKAPDFTHFVDIKLGVDYVDTRDHDRRGTAFVTVLCTSQEEADKVLQLANDDEIDWQHDQDDILHHIAHNAFTTDGGYVDAFVDKAKLVKAEPKLSAKRFAYRADELLKNHTG